MQAPFAAPQSPASADHQDVCGRRHLAGRAWRWLVRWMVRAGAERSAADTWHDQRTGTDGGQRVG